MSPHAGGSEPATLSPTEAFNALGNETRIQILRVLGEAEEPLSFSNLRDEVGLRRGSEFNYHLNKLRGRFIVETEDGFLLKLPGNRIVQSIQSIAVADDVVIGPTVLNDECYHCGGTAFMTYTGNHIALYCGDCLGNYALPTPEIIRQAESIEVGDEIGFLGGFELPPAGVINKSKTDVLRSGIAWGTLERLAIGIDMCPRCSGPLDTSVEICESHEADERVCENCQRRYGIQHHRTCTNCNYYRFSQMGRLLSTTIELLHFIIRQDIDPINPASPMELIAFLDDYEEELVSVDPFEGRFTYTINEDSISLTLDSSFNVIEVEQRSVSAT